MTGPVRASQVSPQADKSQREKAGEAARRAVAQKKADANARKAKPKPNSATAGQLRAGLEARDQQVAADPRARGAVRKAQVSEAVKARFSDKGIGGTP